MTNVALVYHSRYEKKSLNKSVFRKKCRSVVEGFGVGGVGGVSGGSGGGDVEAKEDF